MVLLLRKRGGNIMKVLNNRVAIVTGGAQGIGAAYCNGLANEGARIVIADTSDGSALAQSICNNGGKAIYIEADVSCEEDNQRMAKNTICLLYTSDAADE